MKTIIFKDFLENPYKLSFPPPSFFSTLAREAVVITQFTGCFSFCRATLWIPKKEMQSGRFQCDVERAERRVAQAFSSRTFVQGQSANLLVRLAVGTLLVGRVTER